MSIKEGHSKGSFWTAGVLRLWQTGQGDQPVWRASLEEAGNGIRYGFSSLEELVEFLKERLIDPGRK